MLFDTSEQSPEDALRSLVTRLDRAARQTQDEIVLAEAGLVAMREHVVALTTARDKHLAALGLLEAAR